ncbi:phenylalanine--tRNA ligase subunit beta [Thiohalobacter sp. IOR34]|uniref:phenylalanine--tRNA ligase subunit beta n=1 Tax=Thiohalobacter sp. IOR34 TaxID=3057176 RepID=UPI0025B14149|nr:phenylalanine--tRNA ligase subunit beta [Thiohalobacter sp. IOR34]WJW76733.1 phenylalanine--tRNA ligase subunit beta [Thiohalobacter sp. IOR34]
MKFSEHWLREWVNPPVSTEQLAEQLTMAGLEVDSIEPAAPAFEKVVVGEVLEVQPHPDADKLRVCRVEVGQEAPLQIVCGAPNVHAGMKAPTALVGGVLPGGLKIKKAKLRGVESFGMLCSARELGLSEDHAGLMALPADAPVGEDLRSWLDLDDALIEVDLTPNRGDCLSIAGIAREVGLLNRCAVETPEIHPVAAATEASFPVRVNAAEACPRYLGRVIQGIDPAAATPLWMQERLRRSGLRSLGPVVDVTNYVLIELGQPMHGFDLGRLSGGIEVRHARQGESLNLLDGKRVELSDDTLVIADESQVLAIAGVMGGEASAVTSETRDVFLECAFFAPTAIAGLARQYGLQTDSSHRFERGVDPSLQRRALERATGLLLAITGGTPGPVTEVSHADHLPETEAVHLRQTRITRLLGLELPREEVSDILVRLGCGIEPLNDGWRVHPPTYRFDLAIEADLIEEVGRVYGYERLPSTLPSGRLEMAPLSEERVETARIHTLLVDRGYQEAITYSFVDPDLQARLNPGVPGVALANPISSEMSEMRTSLWPGLIKVLEHNLNRQQGRVLLFEQGLRFERQADEIKQDKMLACVAYGSRWPEQWGAEKAGLDFYDLKGDVEALLALGGRAGCFEFVAEAHPALHPGRSAAIRHGGRRAGWLGELHPRLAGDLGLPAGILLFEIELAALQLARKPVFQPISRYPSVRRDLAFLVDAGVSAQAIRARVEASAGEWLKELLLFDVYQGEGVESGRKSIALGLILQDSSRTLADQDVEAVVERVTAVLQDELGASLRD